MGDLEDMKRLRDKYIIFRRSLGLSTSPPTVAVNGEAASLALVRPGVSYDDMARQSQGNIIELTGLVQNAVLQQVAAASRAMNNRFAALEDRQTSIENQQSSHTASINALSADQSTMQQKITTSCAEIAATQAVVENHTKRWGDLTSFLETQSKGLEDQDRRMQLLESSLQTLAKRRAPEAGLDFTKPRGPPEHDQHGK